MVKNRLISKHTITKLRIVFALIVVLCLSSQVIFAQSKTVSLDVKKAPLAEVFREIEKQTDYRFFYNNSSLSAVAAMDLSYRSVAVSQVLSEIFTGKGLAYRMVDNYIVIVETDGKEDEQVSRLISRKNSVTGRVLDENGQPMIGVSVIEDGTTNGISTDLGGNFTINLQGGSDAVLIFSYIGYDNHYEKVGSRTTVDVAMSQSSLTIDDIVVTALGIKREAKTLTYNVQEVNAAEVSTVKNANLINSLAGKIAGATINASSSGMGGSSRVVMRGTKSLFGSNDALYVVDGIAMPNLKTEQPSDFYKNPDHGDSDAISFLNPDDIENISVLTGAAAAALYGSQGANGVILITTKQGEPGRVRVNLSNNTSFVSPFILPEFQNRYGNQKGSFESWGDKLTTPSDYRVKDFFQTGYNLSNSVSVSFGSEKSNTYISAGTTNTVSPIPNTEYNRYNFNFRNVSKIMNERMTIDLNAAYIIQDDQNMRAQGQYHNPLVPIYLFPVSEDINKYKIYERDIDKVKYPVQYWPWGNQGLGMQNPYWVINRSMFNNERKRYMIGGQVKYEILDWINVTGRVRVDNTDANSKKRFYASSDAIFASKYGHYMNHTNRTNQVFADVIVNIDKHLSDVFRLTANVGASLTDTKYSLTGFEGHLSQSPNFFHATNINMDDTPKSKMVERRYHDQVQATFATAQLDYKNRLFLELTARVDWPSYLGGADRSNIVYPSVGLSGIISDMVDLSGAGISFLKARASYSMVGNPPDRFLTSIALSPIVDGILREDPDWPNKQLRPEKTKSFETGINMRMAGGKLTLDATYYLSDTYNQLFTFEPAPSTGISSVPVNGGHVRNWGIEGRLGWNQTFSNELSWRSGLVFPMNRNKIKKMLTATRVGDMEVSPMSSVTVSSALNGAYSMILSEGGTAGDVYVKGLYTDANGNIWVSNTTGEVKVDDTLIKAGRVNPDFNMGWNNSISYKGFNLNFLIDARIGGVVISATQSYLDRYGVSKASADDRDRGYAQIAGGLKVDPYKYYTTAGGGQTLAPYVYSATNVRLRELSLSYMLPGKWFNDKLGIELMVTANNLWMIYNKAPYDPELTASTGTFYQGFDYFMMPSMRSWGFGARIQF